MMKARVSHLHRTEAEWDSLKDWTPAAGELVIFDPDKTHNYARIQVGDGKKPLKDLAFFIDSAIATYLKKQQYAEILDAGRVTDYK